MTTLTEPSLFFSVDSASTSWSRNSPVSCCSCLPGGGTSRGSPVVTDAGSFLEEGARLQAAGWGIFYATISGLIAGAISVRGDADEALIITADLIGYSPAYSAAAKMNIAQATGAEVLYDDDPDGLVDRLLERYLAQAETAAAAAGLQPSDR